MEFSDESDTEAKKELKEKTDIPKKRATTRRAAQNSKAVPDLPVEKVLPRRQTKGKKSTVVPRASSSEDDETLVCRAASTRRARTRRAEADSVEEPDKMRTIDEEITEVLDISIEQLRTSDTETEDNHPSSENIGVYCVYMVKVPIN